MRLQFWNGKNSAQKEKKRFQHMHKHLLNAIPKRFQMSKYYLFEIDTNENKQYSKPLLFFPTWIGLFAQFAINVFRFKSKIQNHNGKESTISSVVKTRYGWKYGMCQFKLPTLEKQKKRLTTMKKTTIIKIKSWIRVLHSKQLNDVHRMDIAAQDILT